MIKQINKFIFFTIFLAIFGVCVHAETPAFKLIDLELQESDRSEAVAINDDGLVVGCYWMFNNKYYFIWSEIEGISLIELPNTASIVVLNNAGQIAGNYKDDKGNEHGFIWSNSQGFLDIGTLGGSFTRVYDMNDLGQIVGQSEKNNTSFIDGKAEQHAFLWQNNVMTDLGALVGDLGFSGDRSLATSINNHSQIIGTSNYPIAHKSKLQRSNYRAVFWRNGVIEEVDSALDDECNAMAISVNNAGVGTFWHQKYGYFAVDISGKSKILFSINNFGWPFVVTENKDIIFLHNNDIYLGFLRTDDSIRTCFNGIFYEYVYFPTDLKSSIQWKPNSFSGKNFNNNRRIVGSAMNIYGERHAVMIVPMTE